MLNDVMVEVERMFDGERTLAMWGSLEAHTSNPFPCGVNCLWFLVGLPSQLLRTLIPCVIVSGGEETNSKFIL